MGTRRQSTSKTSGMGWRLKRWRYLLRRVSGSLARRGLRGTLQRISQEWRRRPATDSSLELLPLDTPFTPFTLPTSDTPVVSVIIPVYGKLAWTLACLRSIVRAGADTPFEVIVVDDASPDASAATLRKVAGLRLLQNRDNLGFTGSCNAGAAQARGDCLLFLNNDTQVTSGWLDTLHECLVQEPDCGIAGSRLAYPDGRLQEAGGIVCSDASCWNVGRFEDRNDPRYRYRREVDYVSGAALMIRRRLFASIGGFDARYAPAYYEDTDLAFSVRDTGQRVIYEPRSLVIHMEGTTSGTDVFSGVKQQQQTNRKKFAQTWSRVLERQPAPDARVESIMHGTGPHILIVDTTTPEPARDSGSLRLVALFKLLHDMGWRTSFLPDDGHADEAHVDMLGALGVQVLRRPWVRDASAWLSRHGDDLDAVMLCRSSIADQYLSVARRHAPGAQVIFDTVDLHFLREQRAADLSGNTALARQAEASRQRELALVEASDVTFVVSPVERELLAAEAPSSRVELLSNVHAVYGRKAAFDTRKDLVFIGGFNHPPNADALRWMVQEILPRIRRKLPDVTLHILGDAPAEARRALDVPGVMLHGRVDDLAPWMSRCRISVAPLRYGAGVKGKVNMAMSHGLPVVATPIATEGMHLVDGEDVLVAEDAEAFATAVLRLHDDPELWLQLSDGGLANVRRYFSFAAARDTLEQVLQDTMD
ncbi:MAG TPA: glycosyltransferase [Oleiagrimonas sp.]|nr:glycosyltransferase [Oleiagrimonas sp.]